MLSQTRALTHAISGASTHAISGASSHAISGASSHAISGASSRASPWCYTGRATADRGRATFCSRALRWRWRGSNCSRTPTSRSSSDASTDWSGATVYALCSPALPGYKNGLRSLPWHLYSLCSLHPLHQLHSPGIGKTTFLKFLAAARFEGVPPNLQILHIEQEVAGGAASVLEMVLATDVERSALLSEESELLREQACTACDRACTACGRACNRMR